MEQNENEFTGPISDLERTQAGMLAKLYGAFIDGFKTWGHESPPVTMLEAFLLVALEEGLCVEEYAARAKMPVVTMSRHLLDLGDRNRKMRRGMGLVTARPNPLNRRRREYMLTDRGRLLVEKLALSHRQIASVARKK
jgi:DNA-binding MarR family transcriptional regulator